MDLIAKQIEAGGGRRMRLIKSAFFASDPFPPSSLNLANFLENGGEGKAERGEESTF